MKELPSFVRTVDSPSRVSIPNGGAQHENRRAAMFVNEDCWQ